MATETVTKSAFVDTFIERPRDAFDYTQARLVSSIRLNDELADYFRDRAQIEDHYAKSIAKLNKKNYITNKSALGTFLPLWEALQNELAQSAAIHGEYSASIVENIEQPLRSCISSSKDHNDIQKTEEHIHKIARDYDDLELKIQKYKKSAKTESKVPEIIKQREQKLAEWKQHAPQYLEKHESLEEHRLNTIKFVIDVFEALQRAQATKIIEMTAKTITTVENLQPNEEIIAFCSALAPHPTGMSTSTSLPQLQSQHSGLVNLDVVVPEPSLSSASLKHQSSQPHLRTPDTPAKKEKKRFFSSLVSIRRKPKNDTGHVELGSSNEHIGNRQRSFSNSGSFIDSTSLHSTSTSDHGYENGMAKSPSSNHFGNDLIIPVSPSSANPPSLRKAPSFNGSITSAISSQPNPLIVVDAEGFSIPPSDRSAWPLEAANSTNESLIDTDDMGSDAGSLFSNNARIRVDIKNESVTKEDASQSAVALTRVATLLKEKNTIAPPAARRLRGRREMRATQLYSVIEQDQLLPSIENQSPASSSPFANVFEATPEVDEQPIVSENLPQVDVHITETVHVISRGGEAEKSVIWGEVSLQYYGPAESATPICFQLDSVLEKLETTEHISVMEGYDTNTFKINTQLLAKGIPTVCIKYQVKLSSLPLVVKPMWKCDEEKSRLLIKYHKNSELPPLDHVTFFTSVTGNVQNALSIPAGELILSQKKIKWDIGCINDDNESLIKAQFTTLEQASPQPILVRFEMKDHLLSEVNVRSGDDTLILWVKILSTRKTVKVGKYIAEV